MTRAKCPGHRRFHEVTKAAGRKTLDELSDLDVTPPCEAMVS
jgi:hypothetical protein